MIITLIYMIRLWLGIEIYMLVILRYNIDMYYDEVPKCEGNTTWGGWWWHGHTSLDSRLSHRVDYWLLLWVLVVFMNVLWWWINYGFHVYELLILSLSMDAGMVTLVNLTHIWSKGVIHRNWTYEGEVWKHPYQSLLSTPAVTWTLG